MLNYDVSLLERLYEGKRERGIRRTLLNVGHRICRRAHLTNINRSNIDLPTSLQSSRQINFMKANSRLTLPTVLKS